MSAQASIDSPGLGHDALDALMPMHVIVSRAGMILSCGRTLDRIAPALAGTALAQALDLHQPSLSALLALSGPVKLRLGLRTPGAEVLSGIAVPFGGDLLINLSAGILTIPMARRHGLTQADFAETDLVLDLFYLHEANEALQAELRRSTVRQHAARRAAEEQAVTDTLTGLRNRRALESVLSRLLRSGAPLALAHLDLDWFKQVNDTHGHAAGDAVLRAVSEVLTDEVRAMDTVARVGGDEFVLVFPGLTDRLQLRRIGERMLHRIGQPIPHEGAECRVSASIGIALSEPGTGADPARLLEEADRALYQSKQDGRGRISFA